MTPVAVGATDVEIEVGRRVEAGVVEVGVEVELGRLIDDAIVVEGGVAEVDDTNVTDELEPVALASYRFIRRPAPHFW